MLVFHQKTDGIAAGAAAKALVDAFVGGYGEGRRLFVVEGAEADVIGTAFFEGHKVTNHFLYTGGLHNAVDGGTGYHFLKHGGHGGHGVGFVIDYLDWGNLVVLLQVKNREYWRVAKFLWGFWKRVVERAAGGGFGVGRTSLAMKKWLPS